MVSKSMDWVRRERLGCGAFATVHKAILITSFSPYPRVMAVKSSYACDSSSLENEKQVFDRIGVSPHIIQCYGDDYSVEKGKEFYNLLLEFASQGCLSDRLKNGLPESDVRRYAKAIFQGISYIHAKGFVHCDIKPQNILICDGDVVKIADFGLAKEAGKKVECTGTPQYLSPESISDNENESPADIWAFGITVIEMFTGKSPWDCVDGSSFYMLIHIGINGEMPEIPKDLSKEGKDFLRRIFVSDSKLRWTADELLCHPFIAGEFDSIISSRDDEDDVGCLYFTCLSHSDSSSDDGTRQGDSWSSISTI